MGSLPREMYDTPTAHQMPWFDKIRHASEPDIDAFVENSSLEVVPDYGDTL